MVTNDANGRFGKLGLVTGVGLIGLLVIGLGLYWFMFRDTAPASVSTAEAEAARQEAIAQAVTDQGEDEAPPESDETDSDADGQRETADDGPEEAEVATGAETGQPDSAATAGTPTDGVWAVDTSIGTFDETCLTQACGATFVGFRIDEELVTLGAKTVVGRTGDVSGSMEVSGSQIVAATFVVDMTTLVTDNPGRTSALKGPAGGLETSSFPESIFVLTEPIELGQIPAEGVQIEAVAVGDLTVHGVTRQVAIPLSAELQAGLIIVVGSLENMLLSDFDIPKPSALAVVSVEDNATMELQLFLSR